MRYTQINPGLGLGPQGGSMSSPRARITLRPELARSSWLDTMMGKSLKKIGRHRQREQCKEVCFHGEAGSLGEVLVGLEAGLESNRTCTGEQEVQREGLVQT
jgi:hypothetical protein